MEASSNRGRNLKGGFAQCKRGKRDSGRRDEADSLYNYRSASFTGQISEALALKGAKILELGHSLWALPFSSLCRFATVPFLVLVS